MARVRQAAKRRETKAAVVYQYLTGARFKQHMQAIVEAFTTMQEDLGAEKKVMMKQWAKQEMQIERVVGPLLGFMEICRELLGRACSRLKAATVKSGKTKSYKQLLKSGVEDL